MTDKAICAALIVLIVFSFLTGFIFGRNVKKNIEPVKEECLVKRDTTVIRDTVIISRPSPVYSTNTDTIRIETKGDSVINLPVQTNYYKKENSFEAWVSGYRPSLDSINIFNNTENIVTTITKTIKDKDNSGSFLPYVGLHISEGGIRPHIGLFYGLGKRVNVGAEVSLESDKKTRIGLNIGYKIK